jgi:hypothetical protein
VKTHGFLGPGRHPDQSVSQSVSVFGS